MKKEEGFKNYWRGIDPDDTESAEKRESARLAFVAGMRYAIDCCEEIEQWQQRGESLLQSRHGSIMFNLGEWWADRPWRKRD